MLVLVSPTIYFPGKLRMMMNLYLDKNRQV